MELRGETMQCPFCGGETRDFSRDQVMLLRAALLSDIVPALLHDGYHMLDDVHTAQARIIDELRRRKGGERLRIMLDSGETAIKKLHELFTTLRQLFRSPAEEALLPLSELPERVRWVWNVFGLRDSPTAALSEPATNRIRFAPYWDTLLVALHAAVVSLRKDRRPRLDIELEVHGKELVTRIRLMHHGQVDTSTLSWTGFYLAAKQAGGRATVNVSEQSTVAEWSTPLV